MCIRDSIGTAPKLRETEESYIVEGKEFRLVISKESGLIVRGYYREEPVITGGPYLHMTGLDLEPWTLESMDIQELAGCCLLYTSPCRISSAG